MGVIPVWRAPLDQLVIKAVACAEPIRRDTGDVPNWIAKIEAAFRRKIKATPFPVENGGAPFNASGVVQVSPRRFVFVDNHDSAAVFEFAIDAKDVEVKWVQRRRLVGLADGQLGDPEGLTRVDVDGETLIIATSSLCVAGTDRAGQQQINDGLARVRYTSDGDLHAEAMPGFRSWLLSHEPSLAESGELEPDAGGLNIEGLAWDPRANALLFGLRGPASPGQIALIQVPVDIGSAQWTTAALDAPSVLLAEVPQSTSAQGIRDICHDEHTGDFLILLGRSFSRGDEPFQLCAWSGTSDDVSPIDVKFHRSMKPEGITTFARNGKRKILVVDDRGGYAVVNARN
jgi:hypothetical protein